MIPEGCSTLGFLLKKSLSFSFGLLIHDPFQTQTGGPDDKDV